MIYVINQLPLRDRYTSDWYWTLTDVPEFVVLGGGRYSVVDRSKPYNYFSNLEEAVTYETEQINILLAQNDVQRILIADLDFPGIAAGSIPLLRLKFPEVIIGAIIHAGSWCNKDIFQGETDKYYQELGAILGCDVCYVATQYHAQKIKNYFAGKEEINNIHILGGLPFYPDDYSLQKGVTKKGVCIVGRIEQSLSLNLSYNHLHDLPHEEYINELAKHSVALFSKEEETFGYSVFEALACGVVPLTPHKFCYPEYLPPEFMYSNIEEIDSKIAYIMQITKKERQKIIDEIDLYRFENIIFDVLDDMLLRS